MGMYVNSHANSAPCSISQSKNCSLAISSTFADV